MQRITILTTSIWNLHLWMGNGGMQREVHPPTITGSIVEPEVRARALNG